LAASLSGDLHGNRRERPQSDIVGEGRVSVERRVRCPLRTPVGDEFLAVVMVAGVAVRWGMDGKKEEGKTKKW
jgi:hypothetical protein